MPTLLVASRNRKKVDELADLLAMPDLQLRRLTDIPDAPDVEETGATFAENAALKAITLARYSRHWTIADDSGIEVDALGGAPGVRSARYAGESATDEQNNARLLEQLADVPDLQRTARYVCHLAVADPTGEIRLRAEEYCRGRILREPQGEGGFGYDPLFLLPEYHRTFGQLSPLVKSALSHRARALRKVVGPLRALLAASS